MALFNSVPMTQPSATAGSAYDTSDARARSEPDGHGRLDLARAQREHGRHAHRRADPGGGHGGRRPRDPEPRRGQQPRRSRSARRPAATTATAPIIPRRAAARTTARPTRSTSSPPARRPRCTSGAQPELQRLDRAVRSARLRADRGAVDATACSGSRRPRRRSTATNETIARWRAA